MNKRIIMLNLEENIRKRDEKLLEIKMQKKEDSVNGIVRTYPEEQLLFRANVVDKIVLKQWQDENNRID